MPFSGEELRKAAESLIAEFGEGAAAEAARFQAETLASGMLRSAAAWASIMRIILDRRADGGKAPGPERPGAADPEGCA